MLEKLNEAEIWMLIKAMDQHSEYWQKHRHPSTTEEKLEALEYGAHVHELLPFLDVQTPAISEAAVQANPRSIEHLRIQDPKLCMHAVEVDPGCLPYVREQTEEICMAAVLRDPHVIEHAREQTEMLCMHAVAMDDLTIPLIRRPTRNVLMTALKATHKHHGGWKVNMQGDSYVLALIEQDEQLCIEAVKHCGRALVHVRNQTERICVEAVRSDPESLPLARDQTDRICIEALRSSAEREEVLFQIKQCDDCRAEARKNGAHVLAYVRDQTDAIINAARDIFGHSADRYVRHPEQWPGLTALCASRGHRPQARFGPPRTRTS